MAPASLPGAERLAQDGHRSVRPARPRSSVCRWNSELSPRESSHRSRGRRPPTRPVPRARVARALRDRPGCLTLAPSDSDRPATAVVCRAAPCRGERAPRVQTARAILSGVQGANRARRVRSRTRAALQSVPGLQGEGAGRAIFQASQPNTPTATPRRTTNPRLRAGPQAPRARAPRALGALPGLRHPHEAGAPRRAQDEPLPQRQGAAAGGGAGPGPHRDRGRRPGELPRVSAPRRRIPPAQTPAGGAREEHHGRRPPAPQEAPFRALDHLGSRRPPACPPRSRPPKSFRCHAKRPCSRQRRDRSRMASRPASEKNCGLR